MPSKSIRAFLRDESGAAAVEYLLLISILTTIWIIAGNEYVAEVNKLFGKISRELSRIKV